ncbi:Hsp20/alpha crystallin family protein [Risungbinella massiliensis]|uniref:Hsp20/alpha crystallin family protein n=1 Tax=Risungbinella massiliensis TaxID=1329796 RepID=UPI0005CC4104|nr:Hsp20/alpha crystallin family protein [Risungbinella massiliensis]
MKIQDNHFARWNQLARSFLGDDFFESITDQNRTAEVEPKVDVYHSKQEVIVILNLPGVEDMRSMQFEFDRTMLTIYGVIPNPYHGYSPFTQQCPRGEFRKEIELGAEVEPKSKTIRYRRGVVEVRFSKR